MLRLVAKFSQYLYQSVIKTLTFATAPERPNWLQAIRHTCVILLLSFSLNFIGATPVVAANFSGDLLKQPATEITVSLGNVVNELKFEPNS